MSRIHRTRQAEEDLLAIWEQIVIKDSRPHVADDVLRRLDATISLLAEQPLIGQSVDRLRQRLRLFVEGNYIIFYEPLDDGVLIYRILHGAQNWQELI